MIRCYIDIETTGLDPKTGAITRISCIKAKGSYVLDIVDWLLNPGMRVPTNLIAMTGLKQEILDLSPPLSEIKPLFLAFTKNCELIGWGTFENNWLRHFGLCYHVVNAIDKVKPVLNRRHVANFQLKTVAESLGITLRHHDSLSDALCVYQILNVVGV